MLSVQIFVEEFAPLWKKYLERLSCQNIMLPSDLKMYAYWKPLTIDWWTFMQSGREDDFDDTKAEKMPQEVKTPHNQRVNAVEIGLSSQHRNQGKYESKYSIC